MNIRDQIVIDKIELLAKKENATKSVDIAAKAGMRPQHWNSIKRGEIGIGNDLLQRFASGYGVSILYLLTPSKRFLETHEHNFKIAELAISYSEFDFEIFDDIIRALRTIPDESQKNIYSNLIAEFAKTLPLLSGEQQIVVNKAMQCLMDLIAPKNRKI